MATAEQIAVPIAGIFKTDPATKNEVTCTVLVARMDVRVEGSVHGFIIEYIYDCRCHL